MAQAYECGRHVKKGLSGPQPAERPSCKTKPTARDGYRIFAISARDSRNSERSERRPSIASRVTRPCLSTFCCPKAHRTLARRHVMRQRHFPLTASVTWRRKTVIWGGRDDTGTKIPSASEPARSSSSTRTAEALCAATKRQPKKVRAWSLEADREGAVPSPEPIKMADQSRGLPKEASAASKLEWRSLSLRAGNIDYPAISEVQRIR